MVVKLDTQKIINGQYWTNRYLLDLDGPESVSDAMILSVVASEKVIHSSAVGFVSARVSDDVIGTDNFRIFPLSGVGTQPVTGGTLPGWMTTRVDFGISFGRPCRKYYRSYVGEVAIDGHVWIAEYVASIQTTLTDLLALIPTFCDPQGNHWQSVITKTEAQMRQLRRGSRKKENPVIPVS